MSYEREAVSKDLERALPGATERDGPVDLGCPIYSSRRVRLSGALPDSPAPVGDYARERPAVHPGATATHRSLPEPASAIDQYVIKRSWI